MKIWRLTDTLRLKLQKPWGILLRGSYNETMVKLREIIKQEKPCKIICVGDKVSESMLSQGFNIQLFIVDGKIMRRSTVLRDFPVDEIVYVRNPAGEITEEAFDVVMRAAGRNCRIKIVVDGEEDLLAMPAVLGAPEKSFIIYGQPREGIVVVRVTAEMRRLVRQLLNEMEIVDSKN